MLKTFILFFARWQQDLALAVSTFSNWFVGRLYLRVDAAVCIADFCWLYARPTPRCHGGSLVFSRGESRAFATRGGVLLNFGDFLASMKKLGG